MSMPIFLLGQILDVADRRLHDVAAPEVLLDRLRLGGRLDDHQRVVVARAHHRRRLAGLRALAPLADFLTFGEPSAQPSAVADLGDFFDLARPWPRPRPWPALRPWPSAFSTFVGLLGLVELGDCRLLSCHASLSIDASEPPGDGKASRRAPLRRPAPSVSASGRLRRRASSAARASPVAKRGQQRREARRDRPRSRGGSPARTPRESSASRDRQRGARGDELVGARAAGHGEQARVRAPRARRAVISAPEARPASTTSTASASATMMRLRAGNCCRCGGVPGGYSESSAARRRDVVEQRGVAIGIDDVDAAAEHGERRAAGVERAAVRRGVDAERAARDDREALPRAATPPSRARAGSRRMVAARAPTIARAGDRTRPRQPPAVPERLAPAEASTPNSAGKPASLRRRRVGGFCGRQVGHRGSCRKAIAAVVDPETAHREPMLIAPVPPAVKQ